MCRGMAFVAEREAVGRIGRVPAERSGFYLMYVCNLELVCRIAQVKD